MRVDDAAAWAELRTAVAAADRTGGAHGVAAAAEALTDARLDLTESLLVLAGERPIAYAVLRPVGAHVDLDAGVHPGFRRRGVGTALVEHARAGAALRGAALWLRLRDADPGAAALARSFGMVARRHWSTLERDLRAPLPPVAVPAGLDLVPLGPAYDGPRWDEPLRLARNTSFAEHWGSVPESAEHFAHLRTARSTFRPGCSAVVRAPDGPIAGFLLAYEFGPGEITVATVGTLAPFRGRGVAAALLAYAMGQGRAAGHATSSLIVDTQNPTGALGVYTRAGYTLRFGETTWECLPTEPVHAPNPPWPGPGRRAGAAPSNA